MQYSLAGAGLAGRSHKKKGYTTRTGATLGISLPLPAPAADVDTTRDIEAGPSRPQQRFTPEETPRTPPASQYCPSSSAQTSLSLRQQEKRPAVPPFDEDKELDEREGGEGSGTPTELDLLIGQTSSILLAGNESLKAVIEAREQLRRFHALDTVLDRGLESQDSIIRERLDSADQLEVAFDQLVDAVNEHLGESTTTAASSLSPPARHLQKTRAPSIALSAPPDMHLPPSSRLNSLTEEEGDFHTAAESLGPSHSSPSIAQGMYKALFGTHPQPQQTPSKKPLSPSTSAVDLLGTFVTPPSGSTSAPDLTHSPGSTQTSSLNTPPLQRASLMTTLSPPSVVTSDTSSDPFIDSHHHKPAPTPLQKPTHHRRTSSQRSVAQIGSAASGMERTHVHGYRDVHKREKSAQDRLRHLLAGGGSSAPTSPR